MSTSNPNGSAHERRIPLACIYLLAFLLAAAFALTTNQVAFAQPGDDGMTPAQKRAMDYYTKGTTKYNLRKFEEAIDLYMKGYEEEPAPDFLYNIAQAYRQLGDCNNAIYFYKRYLSQARNSDKRDRKLEAQVKDRIKDLEENCKQTEEIKKRPPDKALPPGHEGDEDTTGGKTTGGKTTGGKTTGGKTTGGKTTGGKTTGGKTTGGKDIASAGDDDDGIDDDDDDGDLSGSVTTMAYRPTKVVSSFEIGPAFLGIGDAVDVPTQFSLRLGGGYPLTFGKIGADVGVLFTLTPVPWDNASAQASGTAMLTSLLANAGATYPVMPKLAVRGELGIGAQFFSGLSEDNPFTVNGKPPEGGPLGAFNLRIGLGAEYSITDNISVTASPIIFAYSPAPAGMRADIDSLTRFELMAGVGYRL